MAGFKYFGDDEILTHTDVNGFLMGQVVARFLTVDSRSAYIGTPAEGQLSYVVELGAVQIFNGTAWVNLEGPEGPEGPPGADGSPSPVDSVAGRIGVVVLTKADVGLSSVDDTADSAKPVSTAQATAIAAAVAPRALLSGQWRAIVGGAPTTSTHNVGVEKAQLFQVPAGTVVQAIAVNVSTLGASAVVRLGARADVDGRPSTLLVDFGTVDASGTGIKSITGLSFTVPSARIWLTATGQVASSVLYARQWVGNDFDGLTSGEVLTTGAGTASVYQSGVTGALPSTFTAAGLLVAGTLIAAQAA